MYLYRGQAYGDPLGGWWTTSRAEAEHYMRQWRQHVLLRFETRRELVDTYCRDHHEKGTRIEYFLFDTVSLQNLTIGVQIIAGHLRTM